MTNKKENKEVTKTETTVENKTLIGKIFNCDLLNVRSEMSLESNIIETLTAGTTIEFEKTSNKNWLKLSDKDAYVCAKYVTY